MFELPNGEPVVFDFDEISNHLLEQGLETSPSELHGALCGLLAGGAEAAPEAGLAGLSRAMGLELHGELAALAMQLYGATNAALRDEAFGFHPLLPEDDVPIEERTDALAGWCRGFLAGFSLAVSAAAGQDTKEILEDLAAIAEAGVDPEAGAEESETSLAELVEYLRFAALNLFMDSLVEEGDGSSTAH
jgi:yecA family protein